MKSMSQNKNIKNQIQNYKNSNTFQEISDKQNIVFYYLSDLYTDYLNFWKMCTIKIKEKVPMEIIFKLPQKI